MGHRLGFVYFVVDNFRTDVGTAVGTIRDSAARGTFHF